MRASGLTGIGIAVFGATGVALWQPQPRAERLGGAGLQSLGSDPQNQAPVAPNWVEATSPSWATMATTEKASVMRSSSISFPLVFVDNAFIIRVNTRVGQG
jgi:hypothetical protein